jgi:hypothetical protein
MAKNSGEKSNRSGKEGVNAPRKNSTGRGNGAKVAGAFGKENSANVRSGDDIPTPIIPTHKAKK